MALFRRQFVALVLAAAAAPKFVASARAAGDPLP